MALHVKRKLSVRANNREERRGSAQKREQSKTAAKSKKEKDRENGQEGAMTSRP